MKTFIIDDDPLSLFLTESMLRLEEFSPQVYTFDSADKALETLLSQGLQEVPAVIFLDLNMPVRNGWQFLEALTPYHSQLRGRCHIFVLTSSLAESDLEKANTYDLVTRLIHKPIDQEEIQAIRAQLQEAPSP
jgi:CheY-like chemotaxis protein